MTLNLVVAPDFPSDRFGGWHLLNTILQKASGTDLHLITPADPEEQRKLIEAGKADLIYANPFDSAPLVRTQGYRAVARPVEKSNEMVIVTGEGSSIQQVEDLTPGCSIAVTDNKDVKLIGVRLLEPADLTESDVKWVAVDSYQAAARAAIKGEVDASFFLAEIYHSLSKLTRSQLRLLVESHIVDVSHVLLAGPKAAPHFDAVRQAVVGLVSAPNGKAVLEELGFPDGFAAMEEEDMEFMIDLMDTLMD